MKKSITLALALAAVISLSACGAKTETADDAEPASQEQTAVVNETEDTAEETAETTETEETTAEETTAETEPAPEVIEPSAEDFEYSYDAAMGGAKITKYIGEATAIRIPSELDGAAVKHVEIQYNSGITYVEVPERVESVSFIDDYKLETVLLPNTITVMGAPEFD